MKLSAVITKYCRKIQIVIDFLYTSDYHKNEIIGSNHKILPKNSIAFMKILDFSEVIDVNGFLSGLENKLVFEKADLLKNVRAESPSISDSGFYRIMKKMLSNGEIVRAGRNSYYVPEHQMAVYSHQYLELSEDLAEYIGEKYFDLDFRIFESVQLNEFLNHQIGQNIIFLSIEENLEDFVFQDIRDRYNNNVLLAPTIELYHRYWKENMIVIDRLPTETPKGNEKHWHTDIEKLLVDIMADKRISDTFSEAEFPLIYETAFSDFVIDESRMFRYARRRGADEKIKQYLKEKTAVKLRIYE